MSQTKMLILKSDRISIDVIKRIRVLWSDIEEETDGQMGENRGFVTTRKSENPKEEYLNLLETQQNN